MFKLLPVEVNRKSLEFGFICVQMKSGRCHMTTTQEYSALFAQFCPNKVQLLRVKQVSSLSLLKGIVLTSPRSLKTSL